MIIDFSKRKSEERPMLILKTLHGTPVQTLGYYYDLHAKICYNELSEISFCLPEQVNGIHTPGYDRAVGMMTVDLVGYGQFVLKNPKTTDNGIFEIKECTAYSLEYELARKKITIADGTYNFYSTDSNEDTIISMILELAPDWSIGHIDSTLIGKYRTFEVKNENLYNFIKSNIQETYGCIFEFDTYERKFNIYDVANGAEAMPVYLSSENLVKEISIEENSEDIVTSLDVNGADGVDIRGVNPMGTNRIYNLDYFMNNQNFPDSIISKWESWKSVFSENKEEYSSLQLTNSTATIEILTAQAKKTDISGEIKSLENICATYADIISSGKASRDPLNPDDTTRYSIKYFKDKLKEKRAEISAKEQETAALDDKIEEATKKKESVLAEMKTINSATAFESFFTADEIKLISKYFKEDSIEDSTFAVTTVDSYSNAHKLTELKTADFSIKSTKITKLIPETPSDVDVYTETIYSIDGGKVSSDAVGFGDGAEIIKATLMINNDKTILLSAYLAKGKITAEDDNDEDYEFKTATLSLTGSLKGTISESGNILSVTNDNISALTSELSFNLSNAELFITKDVTDVERQAVEWDLLKYGEYALEKLSAPSYTFSLTSANFTMLDEFEQFADNLKLGKRCYVQTRQKVLKPILVCVEFDFDDPSSLSLQFGDKYTYKSGDFALVDLLEQSISVGKTVESEKYNYSAFVNSGASERLKELLNGTMDLAKNQILSTGIQGVTIDDSGLRLRKKNSDGSFAPEQVWMTNNSILYTDDNWENVRTAIGRIWNAKAGEAGEYQYGIAAEGLIGKILVGERLIIETPKNDSDEVSAFRVDEEGVSINNGKLKVAKGNIVISIDPDNGMKIIKKAVNNDDSDVEIFSVDPDTGTLMMKGTVNADNIFVGTKTVFKQDEDSVYIGGDADSGGKTLGGLIDAKINSKLSSLESRLVALENK